MTSQTPKHPKHPKSPALDEARQIANAARQAIIDFYLALPEEEQMRLYHRFTRNQLSLEAWLQAELAKVTNSTEA